MVLRSRLLRPARLARLDRAHPDESVAPGRGHREIEAVGGERQLDVGGWKARPLACHNLAVALALTAAFEWWWLLPLAVAALLGLSVARYAARRRT